MILAFLPTIRSQSLNMVQVNFHDENHKETVWQWVKKP